MSAELETVLAKIRLVELVEFTGVDAKLEDPNVRGLFGTTPLHVVATWGDVEAARVLLDAGAEINVPAEENCTALHEAILRGHVEVVRLLISRGADLKQESNFGNAFEIAKLSQHEEIKRLFDEMTS